MSTKIISITYIKGTHISAIYELIGKIPFTSVPEGSFLVFGEKVMGLKGEMDIKDAGTPDAQAFLRRRIRTHTLAAPEQLFKSEEKPLTTVTFLQERKDFIIDFHRTLLRQVEGDLGTDKKKTAFVAFSHLLKKIPHKVHVIVSVVELFHLAVEGASHLNLSDLEPIASRMYDAYHNGETDESKEQAEIVAWYNSSSRGSGTGGRGPAG
jgi:hypothetical protein